MCRVGLDDADEFIAQAKRSLKFHSGLVKPPTDKEGFHEYVTKSESESDECLVVIRKEDKSLAGAVNISQIFYGGFKSAYLGYYLFKGFSGKGYMTEALTLVLRYAFQSLKLHRLEANIQPDNKSSIKLVERCGFTKEGFSKKYLKVGGKWRDHERWAIVKEDWLDRR